MSCIRFCSQKKNTTYETLSASSNTEKITIIVDPGHGGRDGGAEGKTGILEKQINLEISEKIGAYFDFTNIEIVFTRTDDRMLYREGQENRKKYYDLKNRIEFANQYENPVFLSIHQNKFPMEKYKGLQVYYSPNDKNSMDLARFIQDKTEKYLQKDNDRKIKEAGRNIYLLHNIRCPAVIIECGFLSNTEEEKNLIDDEYQKKLAFTIFSAVMQYIESKSAL